MISDRELLARCRSGDRDAYGVFYTRHQQPILGYLAHRTPAPEIAADLMAETFAKALADVREPGSPLPDAPAAWLFAISRNLLIDSVRRGKVDAAARRRLAIEPLVLDDEDIARVLEIASAADRFDAVAASLPASEWELLRARLVEEVPYPELAGRLECSEAVVRNASAAGRRMSVRHLEDQVASSPLPLAPVGRRRRCTRNVAPSERPAR